MMFIFTNDYKGCTVTNTVFNLSKLWKLYLGERAMIYFEHRDPESWEGMPFDTVENATLAYYDIMGRLKSNNYA